MLTWCAKLLFYIKVSCKLRPILLLFCYKGLSFWKCGSSKIVALINDENVRLPPKRLAEWKATYLSQAASGISDGRGDDFVPKKFNKKFKATKTEQDFQRMKGEINDVKYLVTEMLEANKSLPLPLGITEGVKGAFQCKIEILRHP